MSSPREELALRKQMLVARSALQRLEVTAQVAALREDLRPPKLVATLARSSPARSALLGLALLVAGRGRLARYLRIAATATAFARLAATLAGLAGSKVRK